MKYRRFQFPDTTGEEDEEKLPSLEDGRVLTMNPTIRVFGYYGLHLGLSPTGC